MRDGEAVAVMIFVVGLILFVVLFVLWSTSSKINGTYRRLAQTFRGQAFVGGLMQLPHMRFLYKGAHVLVDTSLSAFPARMHRYTQFHISWPDHQLSMQIAASRFVNNLRVMLGRRVIRVGHPHFDRYFHVTGDDPEAVGQFLSGGVQHVLDQLRYLAGSRDLRVMLSDGILVIQKRGVLREYEQLEPLIRLGLELFNQAMLTRGAGIEITAESNVVVSGEAVCKICGETIERQVVYCYKCRTPHHFDCWQYYGSCSTYGCGETRYSR